jgi:hypothetical protein
VDVPQVGDHLLAWSTSTLLELLRGVVRLLPLRAVVLAVEHLHHVTEAVVVRLEVGRVDVPEYITCIALGRQEDETCEVPLVDLVGDLDRSQFASPLLVLARVDVVPSLEEGYLDVRDTSLGVAWLECRRVRLGLVLGLVSLGLVRDVRAADVKTFSFTTLSGCRGSSCHLDLEVGVELEEGVLEVEEAEDVASAGPAD